MTHYHHYAKLIMSFSIFQFNPPGNGMNWMMNLENQTGILQNLLFNIYYLFTIPLAWNIKDLIS